MGLAMAVRSYIVEYIFFCLMNPALKIPFFCFLVCIVLFGCNGNRFSSGNEDRESAPLMDGESPSKSEAVLIQGNLDFFVLGRNRLEIETLLGVPYEKDSEDGNLVVWRYRRAVFDEATNITYGWSRLTLKFARGLCSKVSVDLEHPLIPVDENTEVNRSSGSPGSPLFRKFQ